VKGNNGWRYTTTALPLTDWRKNLTPSLEEEVLLAARFTYKLSGLGSRSDGRFTGKRVYYKKG